MSENDNSSNSGSGDTYEGIFVVLAFALILATVLLAVGGVYYTFINPSF